MLIPMKETNPKLDSLNSTWYYKTISSNSSNSTNSSNTSIISNSSNTSNNSNQKVNGNSIISLILGLCLILLVL